MNAWGWSCRSRSSPTPRCCASCNLRTARISPYENLDIIRGIPLSLDVDDLYKKVVEEGKGGFCFELNGLFAWLLRELGYGVTEYAARYLRGEKEIPMRRHRVMKVVALDGVWCCDVGIGEVCPRYPVRLIEGRGAGAV